MLKNLYILKKTFVIFCFIVLAFVLINIIAFVTVFSSISQKTNQSPINLASNIYQAWRSPSFFDQSNFNFIILGLDKRDDALEKTITTDTIIFSSLNLSDQKLDLISLPRDIWHYQLNTKINGIYPLAVESNNIFPFIQQNFSDFTGQPIDRSLIITTDNLINFVDIIGGVDLNLEKGFKDTKYPNPEYVKNPTPNIPIYKTIEFSSGKIHLDKTNVTEFVRSRKGGETAATGGTDIGRIERQQLLIDAIINKIRSPEFISNETNLINLYNFWHSQIETNITDKDLFSLLFILKEKVNNIKLNKAEIPVGTNPKNGVIYHPEKFINKQWVFITSDQNYLPLKQFINQTIKSKN